MEVLGAVSGAFGIIAVTLQAAKSISSLIGKIVDAPHSLRRLHQELQDLELILTQLNQAKDDQKINAGQSPLVNAVNTCGAELKRLKALLEPLTSKLCDDSSRLHRRGIQGIKAFFKDDDIKEAVTALQSRKLSICLVLIADTSKRIEDGNPKLSKGDTSSALRSTSEDVISQISTKNLEEIISQTIRKVQEEFMQEPGANIGAFLRLEGVEFDKLWATNLTSARKLQAMVHDRQREAFLLSLKHPDYYGEKLKLKIPQSGTCEWIFTHPQYLAWCADQDTSVLYSMGKPGSGKTVLSRHVLETLQHSSSSPKNTQVLYYFCNNRDNPNLTATDVLAAIVHQLLSQIPSLFPYIAKKANLNKSSSEVILWPLESLWDMFTIMVAASHLEVIYCILDALDECEAESISELSLLITKMTEESKESEDSPKLKFYLTSRPFQSLKEDLTTARVIYLTPEIVKTDIEKVVDDGMERLQKRLRLKKDVKDRLWNMLVERSEGMFLWVLLAIKQLDRARGLTAQKLEALMQGLPKGLDGIYDRMLEALENDPDDLALARKMLSWVILAPRPLTIPEFREAMAVQESSYSVDSIQEHLMFNVSRDIRTICGSFLEMISGMGDPKMITNSDDDTQENDVDEDPKATVRLIHQSAKDYFFDKSRRLGSHLSRYRIDEQQGHNEIAITCLTYLLFIDFKKSPIKREHIPPRPFTPSASPIDINDTKNIHMLLEDRIAQYPFLEYAVLLWADHVRCGGETFGHKSANSLVTELVCRFLRQPIALEFWHQIYFFRTTFIQKGHDPTDYPKMITPLHAACFLRLPHVIQYLLHNCNADINETSSSGENALLYSVSALSDRTSLHTLKVILGSFPTINIRDGYGRSVLARAASTGSVEGIELLLEAGADINDKAVEVLPALHVAARLGHSGVVELLIARGADIEIKNNGSTALHLAAQQGHTQVVSILLDSGVGIESRDHHDSTALDSAAYEGHIHVISLLLDRGADIESRDHYDSTALHKAARRGHAQVVSILLDRGADIESRDHHDSTALTIAAEQGHAQVVSILLDRGAGIESRDEDDLTALDSAAYEGHIHIVSLLLDRGADIESGNQRGTTALYSAAQQGHAQVVSLLLDRGADIESRNQYDSTALTMAAQQGHIHVVSLLLDRGADIESRSRSGTTALDSAAYQGHIHVVSLLLDRGADIESRDHYDSTALYNAAQRGHAQVVSILLDRGADIESRDQRGTTALYSAAQQGHAQVVSLLLDRGADTESRCQRDSTALHKAAQQGHAQVVSILLDSGAGIESRDKYDSTALDSAAYEGHIHVVSLLLDRGADIESRDHYDSTALYNAARRGHAQVVSILLDRGADIESRSQGGTTALDSAAYQGHIHVVSLLLDRGADIESRSRSGTTALDSAAYQGHIHVVSLLLDRGADIESKPQKLSKVLHLAVLYGHHEIVSSILDKLATSNKAAIGSTFRISAGLLQLTTLGANRNIFRLLLDHEIDVNMATLRGCTALHVAASCGYLDIVESLLVHGADPHTRDIQGWSPIDCARKSRKAQVIERLSQLQTSSSGDHQIVTQSPTHWSPEDKSTHIELSDGNLHVRVSDIARLKWVSVVRSNFCMPAEKDNCYYEAKIIEGVTGEICIGVSRDYLFFKEMPGRIFGSYGYHGHEGPFFAGEKPPAADGGQYATFSSGDVVGCGVNFDRSMIFFTKNGKLLLDFTAEDITGQLYPMIGFEGPGGEVYTNFGQNPFVFQDFDNI